MKNLKHIQIFEAFESKILSKTLDYIDNKDRAKFIERLKTLCQSIGFPLSKMSDEYFEYLPFKSALAKADMTGDEPCEATSQSEFPRYAVDGEKCTNGKIKRQWGSRTRDIVCPVCDGSGVKPKKSEIKLIKFWFDYKGKYIATTLVDGVIRRKNPEEKELVNPYDWNIGIDNYWINVEDEIKDANFAIVFDFGKLNKSEFETTQDTKEDRRINKKGSKLDPEQSNSEIKKRNIERYFNLISKRLDISSDIASCNKLINKSLGHKNALYVIYGTNITSNLSSIIDYYIKFIGYTNDENKKRYADQISEISNSLFKNGMKTSDKVSESIKRIKLLIKGNSKEESYLKILDLTQRLSEAIYDNIKNWQINDIEDLEVAHQKIISISSVLRYDRYGLARYISNVVFYISGGREDRAYYNLVDNYYCNINEVLEKLPKMIKIISKI